MSLLCPRTDLPIIVNLHTLFLKLGTAKLKMKLVMRSVCGPVRNGTMNIWQPHREGAYYISILDFQVHIRQPLQCFNVH